MEKRKRVLFGYFCFLDRRLIQKGQYLEKESSENRKREGGRENRNRKEERNVILKNDAAHM